MKNKKLALIAAANLVPVLLFAQDFLWIRQVVAQIARTLNAFIPILIGIALLVFIWGVIRFVAADDDSGRSDGRKRIAWGLVGLFVVISVWGLVILVQELFGIDEGGALDAEDVPNIPGLVINTDWNNITTS